MSSNTLINIDLNKGLNEVLQDLTEVTLNHKDIIEIFIRLVLAKEHLEKAKRSLDILSQYKGVNFCLVSEIRSELFIVQSKGLELIEQLDSTNHEFFKQGFLENTLEVFIETVNEYLKDLNVQVSIYSN